MKNLKTYTVALMTTFGVATTAAQDLAMNTEKPRVAMFNKSSTNDNAEVDPKVLSAASKHSASGEIGVYLLAGNEYDGISDEEINKNFDELIKKYGVGIEFFIQRTDSRNSSSYVLFMDEKSVGPSVGKKDLKGAIEKAVEIHKYNRGLALNYVPSGN